LASPLRKHSEPPSSRFGEWTVMGIVKRLDDQKRMIDAVRRELEELRGIGAENTSVETRVPQLNQLARNIETALVANKQLTDSMIKIRKMISRLTMENERLKEDIEVVKAGALLGVARVGHGPKLSDAHLRILRAISIEVKSSTEVSRILGKSREHTSRMMSRMVETGLIEKTSEGYIPKYGATAAGKALLKTYMGASLREDAVP